MWEMGLGGKARDVHKNCHLQPVLLWVSLQNGYENTFKLGVTNSSRGHGGIDSGSQCPGCSG